MKNNKLRGRLLLGLVFVFNISVFGASLNGTYSIGSNSADYGSIQAAVTDLANNGVSGPCEFLIQDGNYTEQIHFSQIAGASNVNRIVFKSENNDSSKVSINYTSNSTYNYVIKLNQVDYISFEQLTFKSTSSSNPRVFKLWEGVKSVSWTSCVFEGNRSSSFVEGYEALISAETSSTKNEDLKIENCKFIGGSFGVHFLGVSNDFGRDINLVNNEFFNQGSGGIKVYSYRGGSYLGNSFELSRGIGIDLYSDSTVLIKGNKIDIASTTTAGKGINLSNHSSVGNKGYVELFNNVIKVDFGTGISVYNSDYFLIYHNTVYTKNNGIYFSLDVSLCDTFDISNNIIMNKSSYGVAKLEGNLGKNEYMNNNCFYSQSSTPMLHNGQYYSLNNWKSAANKDQQSIIRNVYFVDLIDFEIDCSEASFLKSLRDLTLSVGNDFRGKVRPSSPTIGAYESVNASGLVDVSGYVTSGTDTIRSGTIEIYGDTSSLIPLDLLGSADINSDGSFTVENLPVVNCWIKILPDTISHPEYLNSFHDGSLRYENSLKLTLDECDGLNLDVHPRKMLAMIFDGEGSVSGFITHYALSSKTLGNDPIPGLDVVLDKIPPSKTVAKVQTNASGKYSFGDLPDGYYQVTVEYKGLPIDTLYEVEIIGADSVHTHLDYCIDTVNQIQGCYSEIDGNDELKKFKGKIYPNPFMDNLNIESEEGIKSLRILSIDGRVVYSNFVSNTTVQLDLSELPKGMYMMEFNYGNDFISISRVVKNK